MLGGSSSINGLIYIRGQKQDFDLWRQLGNAGWSYDDVLPYFRRAEDQERGADELSRHRRAARRLRPAHRATAPRRLHRRPRKEAGYPYNPDFNGAEQEGVGPLQLTVRNRRRCSAAAGYLRPAMQRPNLKVEIRALAHRVLFEGKRAVGVEYRQDGAVRRGAGAARGTAGRRRDQLAAAAAAVRRRAGRAAAAARHRGGARTAGRRREPAGPLGARVIYRCTPARHDERDLAQLAAAGSRAAVRAGTARRADDGGGADRAVRRARARGSTSPDVQYQFLAGSSDKTGEAMHPFPGCSLVAIPCRPESRGWLRITLARSRGAAGDPAELPGDPPTRRRWSPG